MIVLDTNVISNMMLDARNRSVQTWLNAQPMDALFTTAVNFAEIRFGITVLPRGRRREQIARALDHTWQLFAKRVLPFDEAAADRFAELAAAAKDAGKSFPIADGYIAAIAATHGFAVATRDTGPFEAAQLEVINPWTVAG